MAQREDGDPPPLLERPGRETVFLDLKRHKTLCKTACTKARNKLLNAVEDDSEKNVIRHLQEKLDIAQDEMSRCFEKFSSFLRQRGDAEGERALMDEMEESDKAYSEAHISVQDHFEATSETRSVRDIRETSESNLGKDMWKQMKRVSIPTFTGDKARYESWKSAFMACIDNAPATPEYKLLQLRQYLKGEALKCIENLGHSEAAYAAAKSRLDRKYGGQKRQVQLFLEELEAFPIMREESATNLEKFADILDIAVINLTEANRMADLGDGALYLRLQKKLPVDMLARYHRWIYENDEDESVTVLRDWVVRESQFKTVAAETVHGLQQSGRARQRKEHTHFTGSKTTPLCKICNNPHSVWQCQLYKQIPVHERWEKAKSLSLCFRCLGDRHQGKKCQFSRICGINGCKRSHHKLLHTNEHSEANSTVTSSGQNVDRVAHTHTTQNAQNSMYIGLRTVPVVIVYGDKKMQINAILDDGSTQTFLNIDVALELGIPIHESSENMTVNVLNGITRFQSVPVQFGLRSVNGQVNMTMEANTIENVTGDLEALEIGKFSTKWEHLQGIKFPSIGGKHHIDMLIGLDYADLHQSLYEMHGRPGEPIARLTPLGWTCVGKLNHQDTKLRNTTCHTFLLSGKTQNSELNQTLKRFWEIDDGGFNSVISLSPESMTVLKQAEKSIVPVEGRYQIDIPWKDSKQQLCNNREMAVKRLANTEKRLARNPQLSKTYHKVLESYSDKGYITKTNGEEKLEDCWYIPHFPVLRPDKSTTKVRIVFDASAKQNGISLNDTIHQGPPLQNDLFDVLVRFRRHSVAIACDIQEMYLQVCIPLPDRRYHRFLWRSTPESEIEEYEFNRLVFGVNASPFLAQCVSQYNAKLC